MKQIVPFTKTIDLKTNIEEVTSISLDRIVKDISDSEITGEFELYLEYKENDISVNTLNFTSTIPFNINLDDRYSAKNSKVDIDDFYYEIEDSDITLHIDLLIDKLDLVDKELENIIPIKEERVEDGKVEEEKTEEIEKEIDVVREEIEEDRNDKIEDLFKQVDENVSLEVKDKPKIKPIFETFDEENDAFVIVPASTPTLLLFFALKLATCILISLIFPPSISENNPKLVLASFVFHFRLVNIMPLP